MAVTVNIEVNGIAVLKDRRGANEAEGVGAVRVDRILAVREWSRGIASSSTVPAFGCRSVCSVKPPTNVCTPAGRLVKVIVPRSNSHRVRAAERPGHGIGRNDVVERIAERSDRHVEREAGARDGRRHDVEEKLAGRHRDLYRWSCGTTACCESISGNPPKCPPWQDRALLLTKGAPRVRPP